MPLPVSSGKPTWFLHDYFHWQDWFDYIKRRAISLEVWDYVDPAGKLEPPSMPAEPTGSLTSTSLPNEVLLYNIKRDRYVSPTYLLPTSPMRYTLHQDVRNVILATRPSGP
ncbi:hypothetical protein BT63DRAFT_162718 [Microthyrium microscopicum]|uniref:Uncharacterized protein n=1 Tax=Microthyrium microscopicum TaxID=703497 RepID=A0A6A6UPE5_9PEZI|nr:hypothetical protein BT63DRAFT_162718 [Microthyrium microscopicum]